MNKAQEFVTVFQGKALREYAQKLISGSYRIEKQSLNRYKVYETSCNDYTLIDRRSFVLLDKELYRLQARENPLAACIEVALNNNTLNFCVRKASIDAMNAKLIAKTFTQAKVTLVDVSTCRDNYIISLELIEAVSERSLTEKEQAIAELFKNAKEVNIDLDSLETTAKEIPVKK